MIWIADAHCDDGKRFVVHADEKLTAFLELEAATGACGDCKPAPQPVSIISKTAQAKLAVFGNQLSRFVAGRFLLCSLTTNRPLPLIRHGRTCSSIDS